MNQNIRTDKRIDHRMGMQEKCILTNRSDPIEAQTVDMSIWGLGVKTERTLLFKIGCELDVFVPTMCNHPTKAKLIWAKKDFNNTTRLVLKLYASLKD